MTSIYEDYDGSITIFSGSLFQTFTTLMLNKFLLNSVFALSCTILVFLLLPGYESDSVVTECVLLGRINNQTGGPSKTGKSSKRWMVYTNKSHVQYIHRTAALSFICVVMKARGWNSTSP